MRPGKGARRMAIDMEALAKAAADPTLTMEDLAARFQCSEATVRNRLAELGTERSRRQQEGGHGNGAYDHCLDPNDPGISGRAAREAELRELQPWPEGIWFG